MCRGLHTRGGYTWKRSTMDTQRCTSLKPGALVTLMVLASICPIFGQPGSPSDAHPDFEGIWSSSTATPLERPARLKDKEYFTPQEASQWERQAAARNRDQPVNPDSFASYNALFYEHGTKLAKSLRTSIIIEPSDGKLPPLTPAAAAEKTRRTELLRHPRKAADMGLQDQCLIFSTAVPMLPYIYNSNFQIIQTGDSIMLNVEMIHDTRVLRMNRQSHLPPEVRLWLGDSLGHWEGSTLVVDTTNFNDNRGFFGDAGGIFIYDRNLHVTERFTLLDAATILYRFEVDDPTTYTRPWKGELTLTRSSSRIFEYACHEGNYALPDLLRGFRAAESPAPKPR